MTYDPHAFNLIPHMFVISKSRQGLVFFGQPQKNNEDKMTVTSTTIFF